MYKKVQQGSLKLYKEQVKTEVEDDSKDQQTASIDFSSDENNNDEIDDQDDIINDQNGIIDDQDVIDDDQNELVNESEELEELMQTTVQGSKQRRKCKNVEPKSKKARIS